MKNSNIIPESKIRVEIYDGMTLLSRSSNFENLKEAHDSAERIIKYKDTLIGENSCAYAMVFENKNMKYYFD